MITVCRAFETNFPLFAKSGLLKSMIDDNNPEFILKVVTLLKNHYVKQHTDLLKAVHEKYPDETYTNSPTVDIEEESDEVYAAIHDYASYQEFHVRALQGHYIHPSADTVKFGEDDAYWWKLDQIRFLQVILMNYYGLVTQSCEEGGLNVDTRVSLFADCLKDMFLYLKPRLEKDGFIVAAPSTTNNGMKHIYDRIYQKTNGDYVYYHPRLMHVMELRPTRYRAFFKEVESFVIVDPIPGRLADSIEGLFTTILRHVRNGPTVVL